MPSIAIGLFAYALLVAPFKHFSAFSASFAFAVLMLPLIMRTSEEAVRIGAAGGSRGRAGAGHVVYFGDRPHRLPAARPAIITGLLLAIARVTGETAPLLFTAFGSQFWEVNPTNPMAVLSAAGLHLRDFALPRTGTGRRGRGALLLIVPSSC